MGTVMEVRPVTDKPFGRALAELLRQREEFLTLTGNINWRLVAERLHGVHYETLRKSVAGDREPTVNLIEQSAQLAGVEPDFFVEWHTAQIVEGFNVKKVGWEESKRNVLLFLEAKKRADS